MKLDPCTVPIELACLIPIAQIWGIGDDFEREEALGKATSQELKEVAHCLDAVDDAVLTGWLTGEESEKPNPSDAYLAITNLTMAVHSAKLILEERNH